MVITEQPSSFRIFANDMKIWNDWVWVQSAYWTALPGLLISFFKMWQTYRGTALLQTKTNYYVDHGFRLLFCSCFIYYFVDSLSIILLSRITMRCYQAYFMHHITSILGLRHVFTTKKPVFWTEVICAAMHSVVLVFPKHMVLQYIYFCCLIAFVVLAYLPPFRQFDNTRRVYKYHIPILVSLIMAWYFNCLHLMDAVNAKRG
jgi:hypothetical protein